jgi:hypothetical protein
LTLKIRGFLRSLYCSYNFFMTASFYNHSMTAHANKSDLQAVIRVGWASKALPQWSLMKNINFHSNPLSQLMILMTSFRKCPPCTVVLYSFMASGDGDQKQDKLHSNESWCPELAEGGKCFYRYAIWIRSFTLQSWHVACVLRIFHICFGFM